MKMLFIIMQISVTLALMGCATPNGLHTNKSAQNQRQQAEQIKNIVR